MKLAFVLIFIFNNYSNIKAHASAGEAMHYQSTMARSPVFILPGLTSVTSSPSPLRVSYIKGSATVMRPGQNSAPLTRGMEIFLKDIVRTGSNAFVSLSKDQQLQLNIQPGSRGELSQCKHSNLFCFKAVDIGNPTVRTQYGSEVSHQHVEYYIPIPHLSAAVRG